MENGESGSIREEGGEKENGSPEGKKLTREIYIYIQGTELKG